MSIDASEQKKSMRTAIAYLLVLIVYVAAPAWSTQVKATTAPSIRVIESVKYDCTYDINIGYRETEHHGLRVELYDLPEDLTHNLTFVIKSPEELKRISPHWAEARIANTSLDSKHLVTAFFKGRQFALYVWLAGRKETYPDPFDLMILPEGLSYLPIDQTGRLGFDVSLDSTQAVGNVDLVVEPFAYPASEVQTFLVRSNLSSTPRYSSSTSAWTEIQLVTAGSHKLRFEIFYKTLRGNFQVRASYTLIDSLTFSFECYLNGKRTEFSESTSVQYVTNGVNFIKAEVPWIYGYDDSGSYLINFQSVKNLVLRIDSGNREQIDSILLSSSIEDFSVSESVAYDNPCYELTFSLNKPSNTSIGLVLHNKRWFLVPNRIRAEDIPKEILDRYVSSSSSFDSEYIDRDHPLIKLWSAQVVGQERSPYSIARLLFQNLTSSLKYSKTREKFDPEKEFASATLRDREGVCRHFARAFAALCLSRGVPARTVIGTSVFAFNQTYKKNHEWNEVYFPGYGYVAIDVTYRVFGNIPISHIVYSFWEHVGNWTIILSERELSRAREETQLTLLKLVSMVNKKIDDLTALRPLLTPMGFDSRKSIEEYRMLLLQANLLISHELCHEALLLISRACVLLTRAMKATEQALFVLLALVVVCGLLLVAQRRKLWKLAWKQHG